jgi:ribosomal protein S6
MEGSEMRTTVRYNESGERKRFVLRKRGGGYVVFDRRNNRAISYPIKARKDAQRFCNKFVGIV